MRGHEDGVSLIELLAAAFLISIAIVPILTLYPNTLGINRETEYGMILSTVALRKMEENINLMRPSGSVANPNGTATCTDLPNCLLVWTTTTELSSATQGIGTLKTLNVVACQDTNGNSACDAGERQVRYDAKITSRP